MSLGILDKPLKWRDEIKTPVIRTAAFTVPSPSGPVDFYVTGIVTLARQGGKPSRTEINIDFARDTSKRRPPRRPPRRRRGQRPLHREEYGDGVSVFAVISTVADVVRAWLRSTKASVLTYSPSTASRGRAFRAMVRAAAPGAALISKGAKDDDAHAWRV